MTKRSDYRAKLRDDPAARDMYWGALGLPNLCPDHVATWNVDLVCPCPNRDLEQAACLDDDPPADRTPGRETAAQCTAESGSG